MEGRCLPVFKSEPNDWGIVPLYAFDQLDEKTQQRIIDNSRTDFARNIDYDYDISVFIVDAEKRGITVKEDDVQFALGGRQGDGASFVTNKIDFKKIMADNGFYEKLAKYRPVNHEQLFEEIVHGLEGNIHRVESSYCHKNTVLADVSYDGKLSFIGREIASALEKTINEIKDELCDRLYDNLQDTYFNSVSDENIRYYYLNSDNLFFINGEHVNPEIFDYSNAAKQAKDFLKLPDGDRRDIGTMIDKAVERSAQRGRS